MVFTGHVLARKSQTRMDFKKLTDEERSELYISATDYIKQKRGLSQKTIAERLQKEIAVLTYKRHRNIRSNVVKPQLEELIVMFEVFRDELQGFPGFQATQYDVDAIKSRIDNLHDSAREKTEELKDLMDEYIRKSKELEEMTKRNAEQIKKMRNDLN